MCRLQQPYLKPLFLRNILLSLAFLPWSISGFTALPIPAPPAFEADSYALMDYATGSFLIEKNADTPLEPASLTKIMTAYIIFDELKKGRLTLEEETIVSEKAWRTGGSRMFIEVNKSVSINDLLHGLIIQSGNDAAVALAEHVAGSEEAFADMMNQYARTLGMQNTHFANAAGWPADNHVTTARDLAILAHAMIKHFPDPYQLHAVRAYEYNDIKQYNRNKLLWQDGSVDGIKTGHTSGAGYCLVASAVRNDMRLISVIMGASSERLRNRSSARLLNFGFRFYESTEIYKAGQELVRSRIWKGAQQKISLGLANKLIVTIPRGSYDDLNAELEFSEKIIAPVQKGTVMGKAIVTLDEKNLATLPLIALEDVPEGNPWVRMVDSIRLMLE